MASSTEQTGNTEQLELAVTASPTEGRLATSEPPPLLGDPPSYSQANPLPGPPQVGFYPGSPISSQVTYYPTPSAGPYGAPPGMVAINTASLYVNKPMGPSPELMTCKACFSTIVTRIKRTPTMKTHLCAFGCCMLGFWPCALCVYCSKDCLLVEHYCPNCDAYLGSYDK